MIAVLLSILCIAAYTVAVCFKQKQIPYSISATFYILEHKYWFGFTMLATAGLLLPELLNITPEQYQCIPFLTCTGMFLVGCAPNFREGIDRPIHIIGAIMCIGFSQLWVAIMSPFVLFAWLLYIIYTAVSVYKLWKGNFISAFLLSKPMFWVEIIALFCVYTVIFLTD